MGVFIKVYSMVYGIILYSVEGRENLGLLRSRHSPLIHFPILNFQAEFVVTLISLIHAKHCLTFFKTECQFLSLHCESLFKVENALVWEQF